MNRVILRTISNGNTQRVFENKIVRHTYNPKVVNDSAVILPVVSGETLETPGGITLETPGGVDLEAS